ncbi:zinc-binding dehydrogenase [Halomonas ramblicola]|uniref:zinc-binding dehydrogenase n=1 Tax=Halomonas ramblicola TaxID=747349 RepID=UPI0025B4668D|nr:zinc-binding dehydrogenase [Halomonas ramblicola]MDN3523004.1 zinc-binding dehydrogenase [Halomonas ramblicola]
MQLARCRGAEVIAVASASKADQVHALGADRVVSRDADPIKALGENSVTVVVDLVGGEPWPALMRLLRTGGRYASAGAIAGPLVELDLRTLYLKDLSFFGCTWQEDAVFENVVRYIEEGRTPLRQPELSVVGDRDGPAGLHRQALRRQAGAGASGGGHR